MKRILATTLAAAALAACHADPSAPADDASPITPVAPAFAKGGNGKIIPGQYIVVTRGNAVAATSANLVGKAKGKLRHLYASGIIDGFAADLDDAGVATLLADPNVVAVVPDQEVSASAGGTQTGATWGLDRIDQKALPLGGSYIYANNGSGVTVYIVDTGINYGHVDFGGRATPGYDAVTSGGGAVDCNGHGTHVSGTVAGTTYGVAKGASLVGVRVLDCSGNGSSSGVIAGLDWVLQQKQANPSRPMVVNMSLGGSAYSLLDQAVARLTSAGVTVAVAAGNATADACNDSPAREPSALTVGATDSGDRFASFSNYGTCVDIDAPGVSITSDYIGSTTATASMSGTSMATPHVAGSAALYLSANPTATPAQVAAGLKSNGTPNVVTGLPANTVNSLLYVGFLGGAPVPPPSPAPSAFAISPNPASVAVGQTVTLTAAGGTVPTGTIVAWRVADPSFATVGTYTGQVTGLKAGVTQIYATAQSAGYPTVVATLTVTAATTVPPANTAPSASISAPTNGATVVQGASVTFTGSASDAEDGALGGGSLVWSSSRDGQIGTGTSFATTALSVGTHTITLTATDSKGATGTATRSVTVTAPAPANQAPTASITSPTSGASVVQGTSVSFAGTATDPEDGALGGASLVWTSSRDGQIGTGTSFSTTSLSVGTHTVTLKATDSKGATATATTTVIVTAPPTAGPTVASVVVYIISGIGAPTWTMPVGGTAQFGVLVYDAAGKALSLSGRTVTYATSNPSVASITNGGVLTALSAGSFSVRATVDGVSGSTGNLLVR